VADSDDALSLITGRDMNPLPASRALDQFFLDARCRLLDLAAILDRIGRGEDARAAAADPRAAKIDKALEVLLSEAPNKAELIQQIFSQEYDPNWKRPQPRF
jgi:hypothetical protein